MNPKKAITAKMPINLKLSRSNLKSAGGGYKILRTNWPFEVRNPVLVTTARIFSSPK